MRAQPRAKASGLPFHARFTDVAEAAGLTQPTIYGSADNPRYILETIGCGAAFIDYDNDGWLDILVLNGRTVDAVPAGATNRLYRNNRDGTFTDVTEEAGLVRHGWACGVCVGDYNNSGSDDLFITYWGHNVLYRNNGDGTFSDVTEAAGLARPDVRWGSGCTFLDYNRNGHLDLFVANYLEFDFETVPLPGESSVCVWKGVPVVCGPRGLRRGHNLLYRNNGDGTFTDVSVASGIASASESYALSAVAADFDNDGWQDIFVACDSSPSLLYRNNGDGTFSEEALERGCAVSEDGAEQAGMGVAVGDYDCSGSLDLFKTHFSDDTHVLYRNDGEGYFDDMTLRSGVGVETRYVGWGAGLADLDNSGLPDIFFVTGSVYPQVALQFERYPAATPRVLFRNLGGGRFEQLLEGAGSALAAPHSSRGCAFGDFDNDGDVDILIVNLNQPPSLLRNDLGGQANWLKVKLVGVDSNHSAIGATVIASYGDRRQAQAVLSQSSFHSANDSRLHFGLGDAASADLEVQWPTGKSEAYPAVRANALVRIEEGTGIVGREQW
ncbi:MAG: CRTAC1 family protein [Bryobacterales bacterium]|nr:CRTAC1 family protein [Bryobacterales bacterium]